MAAEPAESAAAESRIPAASFSEAIGQEEGTGSRLSAADNAWALPLTVSAAAAAAMGESLDDVTADRYSDSTAAAAAVIVLEVRVSHGSECPVQIAAPADQANDMCGRGF